MSRRGIDVSKWQGTIDWNAVKLAGIEFAIIKAGGSDAGFYTDSFYQKNYDGAKAAGIPIGAYYIVGNKCLSAEDGTADAFRFLEMLKGKKFEYPVYLDWELPPAGHMLESTLAARAFCDTIEKFGYYVGIYASDIAGFKERLMLKDLHEFDIWVARYGSAPEYIKAFRSSYGMWQYSSTGKIAGIKGNVDLDIAYYDFPTIMKANHLNGY